MVPSPIGGVAVGRRSHSGKIVGRDGFGEIVFAMRGRFRRHKFTRFPQGFRKSA